MAVYKIFPQQSATLYSFYPTTNTGLDEIIEISTYYSSNGTYEVSRGLIQFPSDQINNIISSSVNGKNYDAYLKLYLADASGTPLNYDLHCHPLATSWNMGTGRLSDVPNPSNGVSWQFTDILSGSSWLSGSLPSNTTASYASYDVAGGGLWYSGSFSGSNYLATQSFTFQSSNDIELKITNTVKAWYSGSFANNGFILKHSSSIEFNPSASTFETKYFSSTTHTIYPPCLEIRWDDSSYVSSSLTTVTSNLFIPTLGNNKEEYQQDSVQIFRINVRDKYPARAFQTSSVYLNNKLLPSSSYWSIIDYNTGEIIIDYDTNYTKISYDSTSNYFTVYMNGLEPDRYYKLLFKTLLPDGETIISDDNYYFKVIK
jgi:hypothetical protein